MDVALKFLNLSSESDSDDEFENEMLAYVVLLKKKEGKSDYMKKRGTHGEFRLTKEFRLVSYRTFMLRTCSINLSSILNASTYR